MNCQQITDTLDDGDLEKLGDGQMHGIEAHLSTCVDCAKDWAAFGRLRAAPVPEMPRNLAANCRVLAAARPRESRTRRHSRLILLGTVLALAAAAALMVEGLQIAANVPMVAVVPPAPTDDSVRVFRLARDAGQSNSKGPQASPPAEQASAAFTLRVLSAEDRTSDEAGRTAVSAFRTVLTDELRKIGGMKLVEDGADGAADQRPDDFRLALEFAGSAQDNRWSANLLLTANVSGKGPRTTISYPANSVLAPGCSGQVTDRPDISCSDPAGAAVRIVELMRQSAFPADPAWRRELATRLLDRRLDEMQRFRALSMLREERPTLTPGHAGGPARISVQRAQLDPDLVRGAIDLATSARSPQIVSLVWRHMLGLQRPELIQPLIESLRPEADDGVRIEAMTTLAADFAAIPRVRVVLESAAQNDERLLVRMIARRALEGDLPWDQYAVGLLKDSSLPDALRLEPMLYLAGHGRYDEVQRLLGPGSLEALTMVLPRMLAAQAALPEAGAPGVHSDLTPLVSVLPSNQPATVDLFIKVLAVSKDPQLRRIALNGLRQQCDQPRVLAVLDDVASNDPDPTLRALAANLPGRTNAGPQVAPSVPR